MIRKYVKDEVYGADSWDWFFGSVERFKVKEYQKVKPIPLDVSNTPLAKRPPIYKQRFIPSRLSFKRIQRNAL